MAADVGVPEPQPLTLPACHSTWQANKCQPFSYLLPLLQARGVRLLDGEEHGPQLSQPLRLHSSHALHEGDQQDDIISMT